MSDSFLQHFEAIEDPRIDRCKRHELLDIILLAVSAVLSGAEGWEQIEDFGIHRLDWLRRYRPFEYGIPRHDTIARVICRLKPEEIETGIPRLLTLLDIENCIITLDTMGCQKEIAKQIIKEKADYVLALKGNHSGMKAELEAWWHKSMREGTTSNTYDELSEVSAGHGRIEVRHCEQLIIDKGWLGKEYRWDGIHSIVRVTVKVEEKLSGRKSEEIRWYISSLPLNARQALHAVRSHWQAESMHWVLDMTFREDESRIRRGTGALAFNVLRKIALSLFKQDTTKKISMERKKKIAALDDEYRSVLLDAGIKML